MIIGMSMDLETCQILGQVSLSFTLLEEKPPEGHMSSRVEINEEAADIQARFFMSRTLAVNGKARQAEGEAEVV